jgi:hypothetical protein
MSEDRATEPVDLDAPKKRKESGLEAFFRPIVEDEGLRPVVAAVYIGLWAVLGWGLLLAVRDLHPAAMISVLGLGVLSVETMVRGRRDRGRIGIAGWCLVALWVGAVIFAVGGVWSGYL